MSPTIMSQLFSNLQITLSSHRAAANRRRRSIPHYHWLLSPRGVLDGERLAAVSVPFAVIPPLMPVFHSPMPFSASPAS